MFLWKLIFNKPGKNFWIFVREYSRVPFLTINAGIKLSHVFCWHFLFMQTLEITFQKNYHTSFEDRFLMETLIIKVQADTAGEDAQILWDKARQEAELNHRRNNPHLYSETKVTYGSTSKGEFKVPEHETLTMTMEEQIKSCTSPAVLKAVYEKLVKGKPDLETIYQSKLKELS